MNAKYDILHIEPGKIIFNNLNQILSQHSLNPWLLKVWILKKVIKQLVQASQRNHIFLVCEHLMIAGCKRASNFRRLILLAELKHHFFYFFAIDYNCFYRVLTLSVSTRLGHTEISGRSILLLFLFRIIIPHIWRCSQTIIMHSFWRARRLLITVFFLFQRSGICCCCSTTMERRFCLD